MKNFFLQLETNWKYYGELVQIKNKINDIIDFINTINERLEKIEKLFK